MSDDPQPRGDRVLVKLFDDAERIGGIIIPSHVRPYPSRGVVMFTGPGHRLSDGSYVRMDLRPGDEVLFFRSKGIEVRIAGEDLLLLRDDDVILTLTPALHESPVES